MQNSYRIPKCSMRAMRRSALLFLGLLLIVPICLPADVNQPNDRGAGLEIPVRTDPRVSSDAFGCTIVMAARNGFVLVGNNEDRNHPKTIVTFIPASANYYGRVVFGYDDGPVQGGMNDQGLFIDGNRLAPTGWQPDPDKPTFRGLVMMVILGTCSTCEDVEAFFEKSNFPALERARFPVADRSGASMVVESCIQTSTT